MPVPGRRRVCNIPKFSLIFHNHTEDSDTEDSDTEDSDPEDSDTEDSDTEDSDTQDSDTQESGGLGYRDGGLRYAGLGYGGLGYMARLPRLCVTESEAVWKNKSARVRGRDRGVRARAALQRQQRCAVDAEARRSLLASGASKRRQTTRRFSFF